MKGRILQVKRTARAKAQWEKHIETKSDFGCNSEGHRQVVRSNILKITLGITKTCINSIDLSVHVLTHVQIMLIEMYFSYTG